MTIKAKITPDAGERYSQVVDKANELIENTSFNATIEVEVVVPDMDDEMKLVSKFMRTYHSPDEIRKFIYKGYQTEAEYYEEIDAYLDSKKLS